MAIQTTLEGKRHQFCVMMLLTMFPLSICMDSDIQMAIGNLLENVELFSSCDVIFFKNVDGVVTEEKTSISIDNTDFVSPTLLKSILKCPVVVFDTMYVEEVSKFSKELPGSILIGLGNGSSMESLEKNTFILHGLEARISLLK